MNGNYPDLRSAADVILGSSSSSQLLRYQQLQPPPFPMRPYIYWEDVTTGIPFNNRMSVIRRFFCLLVLFDLLLTLLMWFICMMIVSGSGDIVHILNDQVLHYQIHRSFFDVVMSAFLRFLFLLLIYGCLRVSHWWAVALSTSLTCIFLIAKVFVFDWAAANQPILEVMLILVSFILAWSEAWFVDFKVLPQEMLAEEFLQASNFYHTSDQNPVIRGHGANAPLSVDNPESIANFYSPKGSSAGSEVDGDTSHVRPVDSAYNEENEYRRRARDILTSANSLLHAPNWLEVQRTPEGDLIETLQLPKSNTIYRLSGRFQYPPSFLLEELFTRVDRLPSWNKTVSESKRIKVIDDNVDITYQVSPGGGKGLVKSRDFVMLRHWDTIDGAYVLASSSITLPTVPQADHVRGENGPGCFVLRPVSGEDGWCDFQWLLNTNLKTWIPKAALESGFIGALVQFAQHLRDYSLHLHKTEVL